MSAEVADALVSAEIAEALRRCRTCSAAKPLIDFRSEARKDGTRHRYRASCRKCESAKNREWYRERVNVPLAATLPLGEFATQACRTCKRVLPLDQFGRNMAMRNGLKSYCKKCQSAQAREWNVKNADRYFDGHLRRRFGITLAEYDAKLEIQGGVCAICGDPPTSRGNRRRGAGKVFAARLVVDHDHATGEVRGLLCSTCNTGIGGLKDDPAIVRRALEYLERALSPATTSKSSCAAVTRLSRTWMT